MMHSNPAFRDQIAKAAGGHRTILSLIAKGQRFFREGAEVTAEIEAESRRRLSLAEGILAGYA